MTDQGVDGAGTDGPTVGDEARKLIDVVQDWTRRTFPAPPSGHGGPECQWCPLCQLASAMRGEHPDLTERVAEAGAALANAVKALADSAAARAPTPPGGDGRRTSQPKPRPSGPPSRPQPGPRVQRIPLDDPDAP